MKTKGKKIKGYNRKQKDIIFYCLILAFPIVQFAIFYIGVNFNSVLLSFKEFDVLSNQWNFAGLNNYKTVLINMFSKYELIQGAKNSIILYLVGLVVSVPLALIFSFYIYKKMLFTKIFKITLFLPTIVSSIAMVIIFKYFAEEAYPSIVNVLFNNNIEGLLANPETTFNTLMFYTIVFGFGGSVLMYLGAMKGINPSIVESAKIDGITLSKEFIYITVPTIWPTIVTFLTVGVASIFINQMNLFSFFGESADFKFYTFGYYLYRNMKIARSVSEYPYLAAMGLVMTLIAVPVTFLVKYLLEKTGPKVD